MFGQQQQTVTTAAGGALRRAVVLMTVVALMAVMLAMSVAAPSFAAGRPVKDNPGVLTACGHSGGKAFHGNCP
jgi:hypothetical protein